MPYYRRVGDIPRKRHSLFHRADGGLYREELMGEDGFSAESALLYHVYAPTALVRAESVAWDADETATPNLPLLPRHFRTHQLDVSGDVVLGRRPLLGNADVRLWYAAATRPSTLYRNSCGDELIYVDSGTARFESVYGALDVGPGDYLTVPTSTTHRWVPTGTEPFRVLVIEAAGHIRMPRRYLSAHGQLLEHAPFSERDLRGPTAPMLVDGGETDVLVRHDGGMTRYTYAHHPFDVIGWDGCLYPYVFNIRDFEPIVKRFHAPPPVHQTFAGPNFVVCSFCPRPFDFDPEAIGVPYSHANVDSHEVLFYVGGDFMSRKGTGVERGSVTLHPAGFVHGPQPGSVEAALGRSGTEEWAVMIDTFRPLGLTDTARAVEDDGYAWSWAGGEEASA